LSLMDPEARKYLQDQMDKYLSGENYDRAEGFVPQQDD
jgi:Fe-S cluster biosynthesis and repair protein YggX